MARWDDEMLTRPRHGAIGKMAESVDKASGKGKAKDEEEDEEDTSSDSESPGSELFDAADAALAGEWFQLEVSRAHREAEAATHRPAMDRGRGRVHESAGLWDPLGFTINGSEEAFERKRDMEVQHGRALARCAARAAAAGAG